MRTFKALLTTLAVGAASLALAATVSAAPSISEAGVVTVPTGEYTTAASGQMTVLIVKASDWDNISDETPLTSDDIYYINQFAYNEAGTILTTTGMGVRGSALPLDKNAQGADVDTTYYVLIGDESGSSIQKISLVMKAATGGVEIQLGECDGIEGIDARDALAVLSHVAETVSLTGDYLIAADCDGIEGIDARDALAILSHVAETTVLGTVTK